MPRGLREQEQATKMGVRLDTGKYLTAHFGQYCSAGAVNFGWKIFH